MLVLNDYKYTNLVIVDYSIDLETLDGDGTGRTKAWGWPLIRDPQGQIINLAIEFGGAGDKNNSTNPDFNHLWNACRSMGRTDFVRVRFMDPTGAIIEQNMYLVTSSLRFKRIEHDGTVLSHSLTVYFIAEVGM